MHTPLLTLRAGGTGIPPSALWRGWDSTEGEAIAGTRRNNSCPCNTAAWIIRGSVVA
jgi:hypothetical protein